MLRRRVSSPTVDESYEVNTRHLPCNSFLMRRCPKTADQCDFSHNPILLTMDYASWDGMVLMPSSETKSRRYACDAFLVGRCPLSANQCHFSHNPMLLSVTLSDAPLADIMIKRLSSPLQPPSQQQQHVNSPPGVSQSPLGQHAASPAAYYSNPYRNSMHSGRSDSSLHNRQCPAEALSSPFRDVRLTHSRSPRRTRGASPDPTCPTAASTCTAGSLTTDKEKERSLSMALRKPFLNSEAPPRPGRDRAHKLDNGLVAELIKGRLAEDHPDFEVLRDVLRDRTNIRYKTRDGNLLVDGKGEAFIMGVLRGESAAPDMSGSSRIAVQSKLKQYKNFLSQYDDVDSGSDVDERRVVSQYIREPLTRLIRDVEASIIAYENTPRYKADGTLDMRYMGSQKEAARLEAVQQREREAVQQREREAAQQREREAAQQREREAAQRREREAAQQREREAFAQRRQSDYRLRENRSSGRNMDGGLDMRCTENRSFGRNMDGGLDMRRAENRTFGVNKNGDPDRRCKVNRRS